MRYAPISCAVVLALLGAWLPSTDLRSPPPSFATVASQGAAASRDAVAPFGPIEPLPSPASTESAQPQLTVEGDRAILSWIEREGSRATLKYAERRLAGEERRADARSAGWSEARTVASGNDFFVNWADVPSVRALADGSIAAHWLQKSGPGPYAYDVRLSFSKDDGRTWSTPVSPHSDRTPTEHGFASLFQAPGAGAGLGLIWLDGRAMKPSKPAGGGNTNGSGSGIGAPGSSGSPPSANGSQAAAAASHDGHGTGAMTVRAAIYSPAGLQQTELLVDDRVCECCPTAATVTADGIVIAYRNRSDEGEIRDIYVSRYANGRWSAPAPVHRDNWHMPACPVNGPALSAIGRRVALAWFTMQVDEGRTFVAFSDDAGRTFGAPIRVDDVMSLGRVDVELLPDGAAIVSWIEFGESAATTPQAQQTPPASRTPQPALDEQRTRASQTQHASATPQSRQAPPAPGASFRVRRVEPSGRRSPAITVTGIGSGRTSGYPRLARLGAVARPSAASPASARQELLFAWTDTSGATPRVVTARAPLP